MMADALGPSLATSLSIAAHYIAPQLDSPPATDPFQPINLNAPAYVNPSISFNPATGIVFLTYRNADTGKVTEQFPPSQVVSRYQSVDETGMPDPTQPHPTPPQIAGVSPGLAGTPPPPSPPTSGAPSAAPPGTLA